MSLATDMKIMHAKRFQEGKIKQASFLKSFKLEIFDLIKMGYKPSEVQNYLEEKLEVTINMNAFYAWLNYNKSDIEEDESIKAKHRMNTFSEDLTPIIDRQVCTNTMDILNSTDYD